MNIDLEQIPQFRVDDLVRYIIKIIKEEQEDERLDS